MDFGWLYMRHLQHCCIIELQITAARRFSAWRLLERWYLLFFRLLLTGISFLSGIPFSLTTVGLCLLTTAPTYLQEWGTISNTSHPHLSAEIPAISFPRKFEKPENHYHLAGCSYCRILCSTPYQRWYVQDKWVDSLSTSLSPDQTHSISPAAARHQQPDDIAVAFPLKTNRYSTLPV